MHQDKKSAQAIALVDSGVGGLSIMKAVHTLLPNEKLLYVADSQFAPYGDKTVPEITQRLEKLISQLVQHNVKALVLACNTATVNAIDSLRTTFDLPIIGVEPAIKPAALHSKNKKIGLLVTTATAKNSRFIQLVTEHKNNCEIFIQPCPGLVQLIEQGNYRSDECLQLLTSLLQPLVEKEIDTLVLGCTHYPFVADTIADLIGSSIQLIESAKPVAEQVKRVLKSTNLLNTKENQKQIQCVTTLNAVKQQSLFNQLWGAPIELSDWSKIFI